MKKIFVIDDDPSVLEYLKTALGNWGYQFFSCENGVDALEKVVKEKPDLILLDVMLPDLDGVTLCHRFRTNTLTSHIPVIMITSLTDANTIQNALMFGAIDYIAKPFDQDHLKNKIKKALQASGK